LEPTGTGAAERSAGACECKTCLLNARAATAVAAAWPITVLTGAAALLRLMPHGAAAATGAGPPPCVCPVRAALLFTAIDGMYFEVLDALCLSASIVRHPRCACSTCAPPPGLDNVVDPVLVCNQAKADTVKSVS
jgi:hypothetical protein